MKKNHNLVECRSCLQNGGQGYKTCEAFSDKRDVILDNEGRCNGRIYNEDEYKKLTQKIKKKRDGNYNEKTNHPQSKISKGEGLAIYKEYHNTDITQGELAEIYGVSGNTIWKICHKKHWTTREI